MKNKNKKIETYLGRNDMYRHLGACFVPSLVLSCRCEIIPVDKEIGLAVNGEK